jgi:hypothetical protein
MLLSLYVCVCVHTLAFKEKKKKKRFGGSRCIKTGRSKRERELEPHHHHQPATGFVCYYDTGKYIEHRERPSSSSSSSTREEIYRRTHMNEVLILSPNRPHSHVAIDYTGDATLYSSHEPISYCCVFLVLLLSDAAAAALGLLSYGGHSAER